MVEYERPDVRSFTKHTTRTHIIIKVHYAVVATELREGEGEERKQSHERPSHQTGLSLLSEDVAGVSGGRVCDVEEEDEEEGATSARKREHLFGIVAAVAAPGVAWAAGADAAVAAAHESTRRERARVKPT